MKGDRSLIGALAFGAVVAAATFPLLGWLGCLPAGAAAFYVVALVESGYQPGRAIAWGALVSALLGAGVLGADPVAPLSYGAGAALFFAAVFLPLFRRWWFGQTIE